MGSILAATQVIVSANGQPLPPTSTAWNNLTQTTVFGFQIVVLYLVILAFVLWWLTAHTPAGRYLYAIGGNTEAARLSGVRIERYTALALIMSAVIAGSRAYVLVAERPVAELRRHPAAPGVRRRLPRLDAADPGRFNVWGTLLAIYVLATGVQGLQLVSGASWLSDMFNGVALIIAVALSIQRSPSAQWARIKSAVPARLGRRRRDGRRLPAGRPLSAGAVAQDAVAIAKPLRRRVRRRPDAARRRAATIHPS